MTLSHQRKRVGITFESLTWFLVFTGVGTVLGMVAWSAVQPYLPPSLGGPAKAASAPIAGTPGALTPTLGRVRGY